MRRRVTAKRACARRTCRFRSGLPNHAPGITVTARPLHKRRPRAASTFKANATATCGQSLWRTGYRAEQSHRATVPINVKLGQLTNAEGKATSGVDDNTSTCTIADTTASGAQAKRELLAGTNGGSSYPAEVRVRISS